MILHVWGRRTRQNLDWCKFQPKTSYSWLNKSSPPLAIWHTFTLYPHSLLVSVPLQHGEKVIFIHSDDNVCPCVEAWWCLCSFVLVDEMVRETQSWLRIPTPIPSVTLPMSVNMRTSPFPSSCPRYLPRYRGNCCLGDIFFCGGAANSPHVIWQVNAHACSPLQLAGFAVCGLRAHIDAIDTFFSRF